MHSIARSEPEAVVATKPRPSSRPCRIAMTLGASEMVPKADVVEQRPRRRRGRRRLVRADLDGAAVLRRLFNKSGCRRA